MDRRGRGNSGDATQYSIEREYEDVRCAAELAGENVSLIGHSFGAVCVLGAALRTPIRKMVLYEPPLPVGGTVAGTFLPAYRAAIDGGVIRTQRSEIGLLHFASVPAAKAFN